MTTFAYITNSGGYSVSVIDTITDEVVETVFVGPGPSGVTVNRDGSRVYVTNWNYISVIDTATNKIINMVGVGRDLQGIAVSPDGTKVYVTNIDNNTGYVYKIDTSTWNIDRPVPVGKWPYGVAVTPDGSKMYVADRGSRNVFLIDTATYRDSPVNVGYNPYGVAVSPDGTKVYVTTWNGDRDGYVRIINTPNILFKLVEVKIRPCGVAVTPDGTKVYVTNKDSSSVSVIDTATNDVIDTVPVGSSPVGISVTPDGKKVYVVNKGNSSVFVIDTVTNQLRPKTVNVGPSPVAFGQFIGPTSVTVVSPKDGDKWQAGTNQEIKWEYTGDPGTSVKIELLKGENTKEIIDSTDIGDEGDGSFTWSIPPTQEPGNDYKVKISSVTNPACNNSSAGNLTILPLPPSITVISPKDGENWEAGTYVDINWKYTGDPGTSVKIELLKGGIFNYMINESINVGKDGNGSSNWFVPLNQEPGTDYKVKISSINNPEYNDLSSGNFRISSPSVPSITVTSPEAGDNWQAGTDQEIKWEYTGYLGTQVRIELFKGGAFDSKIDDSTIGTDGNGSYNWSIPSSQKQGSNYKVKISSINTGYSSITENFRISS